MISIELFEQNPLVFYTLLTIFSLMIGSFLNVLIYRLPLMLRSEFMMECQHLMGLEPKHSEPLNLFLPRSFCPQCKTPVRAIHNIPILSYLLLKRACTNCKTSISIRYPLIEALSALLAAFTCWHMGINAEMVFALIFVWIMIALFFIDLDHQLLPDCLTLSLLWIGLLANTQSLFIPLSDAVIGASAGYLSLWLFVQLFYLVTGKIGMGNGDFKLFAAFGAWFGWQQLPLILMFSSALGTIIGLSYLKLSKKSKDTPIPFGHFLCLAGLGALFWGKPVMAWYLHMWF